MFHLRQDVILFHPILRKLVNESNGVFAAVQNLMKNKKADQKSELFKLSIQYRSIIRACLENLQDELVKADNYEKEELQSFITIFYSIECIWHLCEILFVNTIPGNLVLPQLLEWIRFHFPKHERNAALMLGGDLHELESNPEFWDTVIGSLLQGRVEVARALLKQHSAAESHHFRLIDQVLKAMPSYNVSIKNISMSGSCFLRAFCGSKFENLSLIISVPQCSSFSLFCMLYASNDYYLHFIHYQHIFVHGNFKLY